MKNNRAKKQFNKFTARNTHKRRSKERAKNELLRAIAETNVGTDALVLRDSDNLGRGARRSMKVRRDEICTEGIYSSAKGGFGFVTPDTENDDVQRDIFVPEGNSLHALDGDRVEVIYHKYTNRYGEEKTEGRVRRIVSYARRSIIGCVDRERVMRRGRGVPYYSLVLIPDDSRISEVFDIFEPSDAEIGDKVEAEIVRCNESRRHGCRVLRNFGPSESREANYEAILAESGITVDFSREELLEADYFASMPLSDEGRVRRRETIFTIDGEGAKDLDDAVSLRRLKNGWQLGVHIADVSYYVRERTHLDRAAMARGTSVYFTDKVVPMLPPALSNGACSLNADEDKYALSAIIDLNLQGDIVGVRLEKSVIRSRVRGVYSEVNRIFSGDADAALRAKYKSVIPALMKMRELYYVLRSKSMDRGALELESAEAEIILDGSGAPVDIKKRTRGEAECLIEQFMLVANEAVATLLSRSEIPCVYRIHEPPPPEKLLDFVTYAHNLGFDTSAVSRDKCAAKDFSRLLDAARERKIGSQISYAMLRSMSKAKYSDVRGSHFGLSLEYYCHFTSPIRRLSDLATHRIIHKVLLEGKSPRVYSKYAYRAAAAATEAELRAVGAERRIENLYKVIYMSDKIGECFDAVISSVTSFGFFAELENTCEGLVPISELDGAFVFDEKNLSVRSSEVAYRIGDAVRVRLEEADIKRGKLRFSVV